MKIRVGIKETENRKTIQKKKNTKLTGGDCFEQIKKTDKTLARCF